MKVFFGGRLHAVRCGWLVLGIVATCGACGSGGEPSTEAGGSGAEATDACAGSPQPITDELLVRHLTEAGFTVSATSSCDSRTTRRTDQILMEVSNLESSSYDELTAREGRASCTLYRGPLYARSPRKDLDAPQASPVFSGRKAQFLLKNLSCVIYPGGDDPDAQVQRFNDAMERLEPRLSS